MNDRDTFAAAALTGLLSQCGAEDRDPAEAASLAYRYADAMLRERGVALCDQPTLTDHERACVEWAADNLEACGHGSATLRKLLERLA